MAFSFGRTMDDRGTRQERGYGKEWQKIRARKLWHDPLCERCEENGMTTAAAVVHHRDHDQYNNTPINLMSLCRDCHEQIHRRKTMGCDVNGMPLDAEHWWAKR